MAKGASFFIKSFLTLSNSWSLKIDIDSKGMLGVYVVE
jgi:hypothetical protein